MAQLKRSEGPEETFLQRRCRNDQKANEKMLGSIIHTESANQNYNKTPLHTRMAIIKMTKKNKHQWQCREIGTFIHCWLAM